MICRASRLFKRINYEIRVEKLLFLIVKGLIHLFKRQKIFKLGFWYMQDLPFRNVKACVVLFCCQKVHKFNKNSSFSQVFTFRNKVLLLELLMCLQCKKKFLSIIFNGIEGGFFIKLKLNQPMQLTIVL